jgi:hypothetical protein
MIMRKTMVVIALAAAVVAWSPPGRAQTFIDKGTVTLSLERVFGAHWMHTDINPPRRENRDVVVFGFGWYRSETAYHNPRAGVDVFVIDHLSLGGSVGVYGWGADGHRSGMIFEPRVGYGLLLGRSVGFWPRGGFTFFSEQESGGGPSYTQFAFSAEAPFVFLPQQSWAILFGPTLDVGLAGNVGNSNFHQHSMGLALGMMGVL